MTSFFKMKKQAKELQEKLMQAQEELKSKEIEGVSPNDLVKVTISGEKELKKIKISKECVNPEDVEGLEDLIVIAYSNAIKKLEENPNDILSAMKGLNLPF